MKHENINKNHQLRRILDIVAMNTDDPDLHIIFSRASVAAESSSRDPFGDALKEAGISIGELILADLLRKAQKPGA